MRHKNISLSQTSIPNSGFEIFDTFSIDLQCIPDEAEDPKCAPIVWVSKWVDYSDKYGFGYALSDESIGVVFNDLTKLLLLADQK